MLVPRASAEWETGKFLRAVWGLLVFRVQGKGKKSLVVLPKILHGLC